MDVNANIMPCAKALLYFAAFVTGIIIAYLLFSLISNFYILWSTSEGAVPHSRRMLVDFLHFVAYVQIFGLALLSAYEAALLYMLKFLCKLERTQEKAILRLKNNPPLSINL